MTNTHRQTKRPKQLAHPIARLTDLAGLVSFIAGLAAQSGILLFCQVKFLHKNFKINEAATQPSVTAVLCDILHTRRKMSGRSKKKI